MKKIILKVIIVPLVFLYALSEFTVTKAETYDDYGKTAQDYYNLAEAKIEEVTSLAKKNDIKSVRLYMKVGDEYLNEADSYLDKALKIADSKSLVLDIYFLKFLITKEKFMQEKIEAIFNKIVEQIANFSSDPAVNRRELGRISDKFSEKGFTDYALKLKVLYAQKLDKKNAYEIAKEIKDQADSHFNEKRYAKAIKYYTECLNIYNDYPLADHSTYRLAQCLYYNKNYQDAIAQFNIFLSTYPKSEWFDEGFRYLSRVYYDNPSLEKAIGDLQTLVDKYAAKKVRDYAELLIGLLYYGFGDYDNALRILEKIKEEKGSVYFYATDTLIKDIEYINKGAKPSFSYASVDTYKMWHPYTPINAELIPSGTIKVKPNTQIDFKLNVLKDLDEFEEYLYDKEDLSRLPKKIKDGKEEDLLSIMWTSDAGRFLDDKQTPIKSWQSPGSLGLYKVSVKIDDIGLVRSPDEGIRKDITEKVLSVTVTVEE